MLIILFCFAVAVFVNLMLISAQQTITYYPNATGSLGYREANVSINAGLPESFLIWDACNGLGGSGTVNATYNATELNTISSPNVTSVSITGNGPTNRNYSTCHLIVFNITSTSARIDNSATINNITAFVEQSGSSDYLYKTIGLFIGNTSAKNFIRLANQSSPVSQTKYNQSGTINSSTSDFINSTAGGSKLVYVLITTNGTTVVSGSPTPNHLAYYAYLNVTYTDVTPPNISFILPTPINLTTTSNISVLINISIVEPSLKDIIWNWSGTNYSTYNDSLYLMMNLDNLSSLGENDSIAKDISKYADNGTVYGATWNSSGAYGGSYQFDGINDFINITNSSILNLTDNFTIAGWINIHGLPPTLGRANLIGNYNFFTRGYTINIHSGGSFEFGVSNSTGNWNSVVFGTFPTTMNYDQWYYVVGVIDNGVIYSYRNGVLRNTKDIITTIKSATNSFKIGYGIGGQYFNGTIDEVRIWNRSLSAEEINQSYMSNLNKYNLTQWYLQINQSKILGGALDNGIYNYSGYALDLDSNSNQTDIRTIDKECWRTTGYGLFIPRGCVYKRLISIKEIIKRVF